MIKKEAIKKLQQQNEKNENLENRFKNLGERILSETENLTLNEIESNFEEADNSSSERIRTLGKNIQAIIEQSKEEN